MKFDKAIEQTKKELLSKYKDVVYKGYEVVSMTNNTITSNYISKRIDVDAIDVIPIIDRFKEIDGEIRAIKAVFDVKYPRKRKYNYHEEYYKIVS